MDSMSLILLLDFFWKDFSSVLWKNAKNREFTPIYISLDSCARVRYAGVITR